MRILLNIIGGLAVVMACAVELFIEYTDHAIYWLREGFRPMYWLALVCLHEHERKGGYRNEQKGQ